MKEYGYEIREKGTDCVVGDEGGIYFSTEESAMESAKKYTLNFIIPDEYNEEKTLNDFDIIIQEIA